MDGKMSTIEEKSGGVQQVITKTQISTHVLDTSRGLPAENIPVRLYQERGEEQWLLLNESVTASNGRCICLHDAEPFVFTEGRYKLRFQIQQYYRDLQMSTLYPYIEIVFNIEDPKQHFHIPLLLNPFGYTTYRGC